MSAPVFLFLQIITSFLCNLRKTSYICNMKMIQKTYKFRLYLLKTENGLVHNAVS